MLNLIFTKKYLNELKARFTKCHNWLSAHEDWRIVSSSNGVFGLLLGKTESNIAIYFLVNGLDVRQVVAFDFSTGQRLDHCASHLLHYPEIYNAFISGCTTDTLNSMIRCNNRMANIDFFVSPHLGEKFRGFDAK
jgi:hypothetical protein